MSLLAAIDIGSNAMRMAVGQIDKGRKLVVLDNLREAVRLGSDVFSTGYISDRTADEAQMALQNFSEAAAKYRVEFKRAVATSALREARNREAFLSRMAGQTKTQIEVISGEEEARLIHMAVSDKIDLRNKSALLIDIGGGSVELSIVRNQDVVFVDSLKLGTVRLLNTIESEKLSGRSFVRLVRDHVDAVRRRLKKELSDEGGYDLCVGTGGNLEALAELGCAIAGGPGNDRISVEDLGKIIGALEPMRPAERCAKFNLRPDRADVIVPAAVVLQQIAKLAMVSEIQVPRVGLKDGVLLDMAPRLAADRDAFHRHQVLAFAETLGRKYDYDELHARAVLHLAARLFDSTVDLHKLDDGAKLILEVAALIHDIGQYVNITGHHKHSLYLITSTPFVGLSPREKSLVALVSRYHRKALPSQDHEEFRVLSRTDQEIVRKLAAILRVADVLDKEHADKVKDFSVECGRDQVKLTIAGHPDLEIDNGAIRRKADLFEEVFKRRFLVTV